jgi:hypothetical protein
MLRRSRINPRLSAHTQIFGVFDYNQTPLAPIGTRTVVVHKRTTQQSQTTFGNHGAIGRTIGLALDHYRHWEFFIPKTRGTRVSDTVVFLLEKYSMPTTASANRVAAALEELTEAFKNQAAAKPFLNTGNKLNAAIDALTEILSNHSATPSNSEASPPRVSERTARTPRMNTAQAGSPPVENDPKQVLRHKISPKVAVRGLINIISMCAPSILYTTNNIKKATSIPTKLVNNNNNINDKRRGPRVEPCADVDIDHLDGQTVLSTD